MPTLTIDNREVTVPEGTNVLDAAKALGIVIPHFCYHEALGAVGACRLCAMHFENGPVKGVQMACMVPAANGMVVSTTEATASELRSRVIEWLMTNHPHDCPVCDEGGECQLQDMTIAGGHGLRRYTGPKRTYQNQDLGPFVEQEMNRCITCYRCVRTYRDYCGGDDFGVFGSRNRVFFGRFQEGRLQSPFSGNLVDVCPTGVFTDKTFRFKSRYWDLQEAPSICPHCSLGCAVVPGGRYRELQRVRAGVNEQTNGFFICDRGRFGSSYVNHPDRPRVPRVDGKDVPMAEAVQAAVSRVRETVEQHGPQAVAFIGSGRASLEGNAMLKAWARSFGATNLVFEAHCERDRAQRITAARLKDRSRSLADVRQSDLIILIGADPLNEAPTLALALRQAVRNGGRVVLIDPRPIELPCPFEHLPLVPAQLAPALQALTGATPDELTLPVQEQLSALAADLGKAEQPILIGGTDMLSGNGIDTLFESLDSLSTPERTLGAMILMAGPNSFGGALLSEQGPDFDTLLDAIQEGQTRVLVSLEADPFRDVADPARAQAALGHLAQLIVLDSTPSLTAHRADIFLPTRATAEMEGSFINNEGRMQRFQPVIDPGLPLRDIGHGSHPPREFRADTPGDAPQPDWQILARALGRPIELPALRHQLAGDEPRLSALGESVLPAEGLRLNSVGGLPPAATPELPESFSEGSLPLLTVSTLAGPWLAHLSAPLTNLQPEPSVWLHPDLAEALHLTDSETVRLTTHLGHCHVVVRTVANMSRNLILAPHLWDSALEALPPGSGLHECRLDKEESA